MYHWYYLLAMLRRGSMAIGGGGEPLIVVEESGLEDDSSLRSATPVRGFSVDQESPPDPYHLSPWRDTRKHSLPTPSCTTGPTASQVTRMYSVFVSLLLNWLEFCSSYVSNSLIPVSARYEGSQKEEKEQPKRPVKQLFWRH